MTIGNRIIASCGVLVGLTVVLGSGALVAIHRLDVAVDQVDHDAMPGIYLIGRAESAAKDIRARMLMHIASSVPAEIAQFESDIAAGRVQFEKLIEEYAKTVTREHDRELFAKIQPAFERYMAAWEPTRVLSTANKNEEAFLMFEKSVLPAFQELQKAIGDEVEDNNAYGNAVAASADSAVSTGQWTACILLLVSLLCGGGLAFFIGRSVTSTLTRSIEEIGEGAGQVAGAATQVASASQALAQGASEQASSLEETSASTNEISSMTHQNADNSRRAAEVVDRANAKVVEANRTLAEMVTSMSQINESSQKISKIIKVIDEIAFQTNILALNAAVEAARAGEAGMGFAVVADEVRNLAQRSAQAAKDTAALIEESVTKSSEGSTRMNQVAEAIRGITEETAQVKTLVDEVSAASGEQTRGMDQIGKAIVEMEQITQRNAASSEQSASASEELSAQAEHMKQVIAGLRALVDSSAAKSYASIPSSRSSEAGRGRATSGDTALGKVAVRRSSRASASRRREAPSEDSIPMPGDTFSAF